jgi:hypothetical protein
VQLWSNVRRGAAEAVFDKCPLTISALCTALQHSKKSTSAHATASCSCHAKKVHEEACRVRGSCVRRCTHSQHCSCSRRTQKLTYTEKRQDTN